MNTNPNIALGVQPVQIPNALANYAQFAQLQKYTQDVNNENKLNTAYARAYNPDTGEVDINKLRSEVAGAGIGSQLPKLEASMLTTRKLKGEVEKNDWELMRKRIDQGIKDLVTFDTVEGAQKHIQDQLASKQIDPATAQRLASTLPANDAEMPAWQVRTLRNTLDAKDRLEQHFTTQDLGGSTRVLSMPKYAGGGSAQVVAGSAATKTATPGELLTNAREKERIANAENKDVVAKQVVGEDGTVTNFNKFGEVVSTVKGAGKQSATYAKTEAQKRTMGKDLDLAIGELANVTKDGGLIDQSTGSYIGKAVDIGARAIGKATPGDVAAGKLAPIADLALKMVPRFEGPQSNADTLSYKQAAGQLADSTLPAEIRKEAGKEVLRLMKARRNQFITSDMASGNTATPSIAPPDGFVPDSQ